MVTVLEGQDRTAPNIHLINPGEPFTVRGLHVLRGGERYTLPVQPELAAPVGRAPGGETRLRLSSTYFALMATKRASTVSASPSAPARAPYMLIEQIQVKGYKSLVDATLHVRPLTLLAGTNSSGKSSIMQPLLLIKQTMEAPYQPAGALLLDGAHVQAETAGELVSKVSENKFGGFLLSINGVEVHDEGSVDLDFQNEYKVVNNDFILLKQKLRDKADNSEISLEPGMSLVDLYNQLRLASTVGDSNSSKMASVGQLNHSSGFFELSRVNAQKATITLKFTHALEITLGSIMHIPALRILPRRTYLATTFQYQIKGTFDVYAAGTISQWQQQGNTVALTQLNDYLQRLGLTDTVTAKVKNANEIELSVSRLPAGTKAKARKADMVNIADVGIGVSQVLPILVALIAAQEGQIVYVEQPELHLHPRAQVAMAELLAEAANRGVRVIVETHSSLLLLTVQTLIAEDKIKPTDVALHWFARDAKGATRVTYVQPDEDGAYGDWPEDFGDVELKAQDAYLTAVGLRQFGAVTK